MNCKNCHAPMNGERTRCIACSSLLHAECSIKEAGNHYCDLCYADGATIQTQPNQIVLPDVIRRSYIELYKRCPYAFYLQVIKGNEVPSTIYTQLGIDLHEMFDRASHEQTYTAKLMKQEFEQLFIGYKSQFADAFKEKDGFEKDMYSRGIDSIDAFDNLINTFPQTPFRTEEKIEFSIGDELPKVSITMDRIDEDGESLIMRDYKTGHVMVGQKLSSDLQAPLYIHAVQEKYKRPVSRFEFYYLQENKVRIFERVDEHNFECRVNKRIYKINTVDAIKEVQHIFSQIKKGNFNIPRDVKGMYFACKMCHFKESGLCQGADLEAWKQSKEGLW